MNLLQGWQLVDLLVLPLAAQLGFLAGARRAAAADPGERTQIGAVQGALLGLLALLLGFSASMADGRFEARRRLIVDEANAIGTAALRAEYLPEPHASELARLFREYVDQRVAFYETGADLEAEDRVTARVATLQRSIWDHTTAVARAQPSDVVASYVEATNEAFDMEGARWAAVRAHVPPSLLWLLFIVGVVAIGTTGYACGLTGKRSWLSLGVMPVLLALAFVAVLDLDSPRIGFVRTGQDAMLRLQQSLRSAGAGPRR